MTLGGETLSFTTQQKSITMENFHLEFFNTELYDNGKAADSISAECIRCVCCLLRNKMYLHH